MNIIIVSIHLLAVLILVLSVLLQTGKGSGMGAAFGGASGSVFGSRGPTTFISKITCGAAVVFMCTSLTLAVLQGGLTVSSGSVTADLEEWGTELPAVATPAKVAPAKVAPAKVDGAVATPVAPAVDGAVATPVAPAVDGAVAK